MRDNHLIQYLALVLIVAFTIPAFSQSTKDQDRTLEISGARLTLGMNQSQVFSKLRDANLLISGPNAMGSQISYFVCGPTTKDCDPALGSLTFKNDVLAAASKRWADNSRTISDLLTAFYGAAVDFENRGLSQCKIATTQQLTPNLEAKSVNLLCGPYKRLSVSLVKAPLNPYYNVIEEFVSLVPPK
jgi:hypothetical protein